MNNVITFDQILNLGDTILEITSNKNILMDDSICSQYNIIKCKKNLQELFKEIKTSIYLFSFPKDEIKITPNYDRKVGSFQKSKVSPVEKIVDRNIDSLLHMTDLYNKIIETCRSLTGDEGTYVHNTFFDTITEEKTAEIIGISRTQLQKIKKSSIVKLWIKLNTFIKED